MFTEQTIIKNEIRNHAIILVKYVQENIIIRFIMQY